VNETLIGNKPALIGNKSPFCPGSCINYLPDVKAARFFSLLESHSSMLDSVDDLPWSGSSFRCFSSDRK